MGIYKIITAACCLSVLVSCGESKNQTVSQSKYDAVVEECNRLKAAREATMASNIENAELIDGIFTELRTLTGRTTALQIDVETNKSNDMTKAEEIAEDLKILKERLEAVQNKTDKEDKQLNVVIANLRQVIQQQETEIANLKQEIRNKDEQISVLDRSLASAQRDLSSTKVELNATNEKLLQAQMHHWIELGDQLLESAELLPDTKGHGNMKPIRKAKLSILKDAISCYKQAAQLGHPNASVKISSAQRVYNRAAAK